MANPFKPGNRVGVGNKGKSPRDRAMTQALVSQLNEVAKRAVLSERYEKQANGKLKKVQRVDHVTRTKMDHIIAALIENAADGNNDAIKVILERVDGRVVQAVEHGSADGDGVIKIKMIEGDDKV